MGEQRIMLPDASGLSALIEKRKSKRFVTLVVLSTIACFISITSIFGFFQQRDTASSSSSSSGWSLNPAHLFKDGARLPHGGTPVDVAIVESAGYHDEVIAALIHAFGSQPDVNLSLYQRKQRYGIKEILDQFSLAKPLPEAQPWNALNDTLDHPPSVVVSTTCEVDTENYESTFAALFEKKQTHLFCVIHHADIWGNLTKTPYKALKPWANEGLVTFLALSERVEKFLNMELDTWNLSARAKTQHFVPVFPVDVSPRKYSPYVDQQRRSFALQGNYDAARRDYGHIFAHMRSFLDHSRSEPAHDVQSDLELRLLGHGKKPQVPEPLMPFVKFDEDLDYLTYYAVLESSFALLPAFASNDYLDRKASSSVPASMIGGAPLVATQAILDAYSYLPADAVWLQGDKEGDFDVIARVIAMSAPERLRRKAAVADARDKRIAINKVLAGSWLRQATSSLLDLRAAEAMAAKAAEAAAAANKPAAPHSNANVRPDTP